MFTVYCKNLEPVSLLDAEGNPIRNLTAAAMRAEALYGSDWLAVDNGSSWCARKTARDGLITGFDFHVLVPNNVILLQDKGGPIDNWQGAARLAEQRWPNEWIAIFCGVVWISRKEAIRRLTP